MNQEEKELLQKTYELTEENNKILHGIRRVNRWSFTMKIIYWTIIAIIAFGAYFYVQPYVKILDNTYKSIVDDIGSIKNVTSKISNPFR